MLMWNTYLIGDLRLYDRTQSLPLGLSLEGYNKYIIKRVNQFVQDDNDILILMGDISHGTLEQTVDVLTQFNGTVYLMSTQFQEFLNDITLKPYNNKIKTLWGISDFQDSKIGNEISRIVITADAQQIYQLQFVDNTYIAAPTENIQARYMSTWLKEHQRYKDGKRTAIGGHAVELHSRGRGTAQRRKSAVQNPRVYKSRRKS